MPKSFISEHSAEYILVPKLVDMMEHYFSKVIPVYFWSTREGSAIARACRPLEKVRIIRVFARRPKINVPNQESIEVKFNQSLFENTDLTTSLGIPTFAGVPLASSILDLSFNTECAWFELKEPEKDIVYELSLDAKIIKKSSISSSIEGPIDEIQLIDKIATKSCPMEWHKALDNLRILRRIMRRGFWFGAGGYRPFYILFFD